MKFSYSAVWDDTVRMLRGNGALLTALAGVFLFLPALLVAYFIPQQPTTPDRMLGDFIVYVSSNIHWLLISRLVNMVGTLAMLILLLGRSPVTVGGAISGSFHFLLVYFLATILSGLMITIGFFLLILPGLYLFARMAALGPAIVAEDRQNPINAIKRSFEVTKKNGWAILGLLAIIAVVGYILGFVLSAVLGSLFLLVAGRGVGGVLLLILQSGVQAALGTVIVVLFTAIYRRLTAAASSVPVTH